MRAEREPIAIVGFGGLFPGASDLEGLWDNLVRGVDSSREVPEGRWGAPAEAYYDPHVAKLDRVYSTRGCFLDSIPLDPAALGLDPDWLDRLDPVFRLALCVATRALQDARGEPAARERTGVILANIILPTETTSELTREMFGGALAGVEGGAGERRRGVDPLNRYMAGLVGGLVAKSLGFGAGSYTLDAACASSLYAIRLACEKLRTGRADAMLAGGVSRPDCLYTQMGFSQLHALSPSGRAMPFDARADGLVVGEGGGAFLLKRLSDALKAGDRICGVIRGIGLSNDTGGSLLAPDSEGQLRAMREAYRQAGWAPSAVDLVECHATGTPLGDATEIKSLKALWGDEGWGHSPGQCSLGSIKSNVGHLLVAAGAAGLVKVMLAMQNETLPPSANFERAAPQLGLDEGPFRVQREAAPWEPRDGNPRRAAVSAFGFGGINAHLLIEQWRPRPADRRRAKKGKESGEPAARTEEEPPVAIIGMEARFGALNSLEEFRAATLAGRGALAERPQGRWAALPGEGSLAERARRGCYLDRFEIALGRFRIPPNELKQMLPQQALMLEVVAGAIEDAGLDEPARERTGVFIGLALDLNTTNYCLRWGAAENGEDGSTRACGPPLTADRTTGGLGAMVASRIARAFRLGGPSFTLSAEENSGLRALEVAVQMLECREIDRAIVGAVDLAGDVRAIAAADALRPWREAQDAGPLSSDARGAAPGEGAAAVVLERLDDAREGSSRVYCVVRAIGSASGGKAENVAPRPEVYRLALERAYREAAIEPASIGYLEAHASGYSPEDAVEADALVRFFSAREPNGDESRARRTSSAIALGSVKSVIGHTGAASGLAALVKTALCLYHEILPPLRGFGEPREELAEAEGIFHVPMHPQYWCRNRRDGPRLAGVSSIGLDGNCMHVVLEALGDAQERKGASEATVRAAERRNPLGPREEALFAIEAETPDDLIERMDEFLGWSKRVGGTGARPIEAVAREWWRENGGAPRRMLAVVLVAGGLEQLRELALAARARLTENPARAFGESILPAGRAFYSPEPLGREGRIAFVFPGSGNQYVTMGQQAAAHWPEIMRALDGENERLADQFAPAAIAPRRLSWQEGWEGEAEERLYADHRSLIFAHVAHGAMLSDLVRGFGIEPQAVIGYSLGECAGYFAMRAWTARDEMVRRIDESTLFVSDLVGECNAARKAWELGEDEAVDWRVGLVDRPAAEVKKALRRADRVYLLIINTPEECVVGGQGPELMKLIEKLDCNFVPIQGVSTVHCEVAMQVQNAYRGLHLFKTRCPAGVKFYSSAWGRFFEVGRQSTADAIVAQAIGTIDFPRMIEQAYEDGVRLFLEMGPRASCSRMIDKILGERSHWARSACLAGQSDVTSVLRLLAGLIAERVPVDLSVLYGDEGAGSRVDAREDALSKGRTIVFRPGSELEEAAAPKPIELESVLVNGNPAPGGDEVSEASRSSPPPARPAIAAERAAVLAEGLLASQQAAADAHETFLRLSESATRTHTETLRLQIALLEEIRTRRGGGAAAPAIARVVFSREDCLQFARGRVAPVLGPEFAEIDEHPTRVRLPDEPLMLVDRVTRLEGEPMKLGAGSLTTEHDVRADGWYLDQDRMVAGVAIESGQADLFLSSYLGIDFVTKGRVYRLLDAEVTFHRGLPRPGEVLRYEIRIERFMRQGQTRMFLFGFEAFAGDERVLTMRNGCAGFFSERQLAQGRGIVTSDEEPAKASGPKPSDCPPLVPMQAEAYDDAALEALRTGDLVRCFGDEFERVHTRRPVTIPGGRLKLIDRVTRIEPEGGRFGLGFIEAEIDIHPDDWFLTCHFVGDPVMPGTLMYESCLQALRVYLLRMGWIVEAGEARFEPRPGRPARLKCRGQVVPSTRKASYEISIKELGYGPEPFAVADAVMYADGRAIVEVIDISLQLSAATRARIERTWRDPRGEETANEPDARAQDASRYDRQSIVELCTGKPSLAFGERYRPFDDGRFIARLPAPPYSFLDRIVAVEGPPWVARKGAAATAEYTVPPDAWYFAANRQPNVPYSVILEAALQSCGWLATYMGSALESEGELRFRNLGGTAVLHEEPAREAGTLLTRTRLTDVSRSGGMIIQSYEFEMTREGRTVFEGKTTFGYFGPEALAEQVGLRAARLYAPGEEESKQARTIEIADEAPLHPGDPERSEALGLTLPARAFRMIDSIEFYAEKGGAAGLGFIRGVKRVDPKEWFFKAHFFQDPVWPGSLGLEAFLQLIKVVAIERWGAEIGATHRFEPIALGVEHTWSYRGQVLRTNRLVTVEASIEKIDEASKFIQASGYLSVDGLTIYEMKDFALRAVPGPAARS